ncbi:MAG: HAMP domain-containing sensor histidine kinase [Candidatus Wildermuthbacteria bacterium]|nr:HAMP domain-containing sensor histidine kinase [Candidatus Wildermuthbacteria bacterium]
MALPLSELNVFGHCRKYGLSLFQCPHFLFLLMGTLIIVSILLFYAVGSKYIEDPLTVAFVTLILACILLAMAFIITDSFQRLAENARLKTEFVSIVSHQLRSPLSNMKWGLEILLSGRAGKVEAGEVEYLQILKENSDRMHELINDLLIASRIEEGGLTLQRQEFSLKELLADIVAGFKPWMIASNMHLDINGDENVSRINTDPSFLRQVIQNLLDNAIRYGKSAISIRYHKKGKALYLAVEDDGVGIPKEDQKFIFQRFFRSGNARKHQTEGSGLGLYIAKSMLEKFGGSIGFNSEENKGSTFWFTIPL